MISKKTIFFLGIFLISLGISNGMDTDEHISKVFESENIHDDSTLLDLLEPRKINRFKELIPHLSSCFHSTEFLKNHKKHIFSYALRMLIRKYFMRHSHWVRGRSIMAVVKRIKLFIISLKQIGNGIINCMEDIDVGQKGSHWGLTALSALTSLEYKEMFLIKALRLKFRDGNEDPDDVDPNEIPNPEDQPPEEDPDEEDPDEDGGSQDDEIEPEDVPEDFFGTSKKRGKRDLKKPKDNKGKKIKKIPINKNLKKFIKEYNGKTLVLNPFYPENKINLIKDSLKKESWNDRTDVRCSPNNSKYFNQTKPMKFSWRHSGVVSKIGYQGSCSSSWAFATRDLVETYFRKTHNIRLDDKGNNPKNVHFTEQDLIDCYNLNDYKGGCGGGAAYDALTWFQHYGIPLSKHNPYKKRYNANKQCSVHKPHYKIPGFCGRLLINKDNVEEVLKTYLLEHGPVLIGIKGNGLQNLRGPLETNLTGKVNHIALLVGWTENYWIVKNSFGPSWGNKGYLYLGKRVESGIEANINFIRKA